MAILEFIDHPLSHTVLAILCHNSVVNFSKWHTFMKMKMCHLHTFTHRKCVTEYCFSVHTNSCKAILFWCLLIHICQLLWHPVDAQFLAFQVILQNGVNTASACTYLCHQFRNARSPVHIHSCVNLVFNMKQRVLSPPSSMCCVVSYFVVDIQHRQPFCR